MSIEVKLKKNENVDKALRKLKRLMASEGILKELKERQYFQKPGDRKRNKQAQARSRVSKENRMKEQGIM